MSKYVIISKGDGMADYGSTDRVRTSAAERFVAPARQKRQRTFEIHSGSFARALVKDGLLGENRFPIVCNALRSRRFLNENGLKLLREETRAASGLSSDVTFVYAIDAGAKQAPTRGPHDGDETGTSFASLRGLFKEVYAKFGGAEAAIQKEREEWSR